VCPSDLAQSTGNKADMRAVVQTVDPATGQFTGIVMNQPLNFPRGGYPLLPCPGEGWYPWTNTWPWTQDGKDCTAAWNPERGHVVQNPEPMLSDIVFETNGDMVLGFSDRFVDRFGWVLPSTSTQVGSNAPTTTSTNGGDINRACPGADGKFVLDGNGGCTNNATPETNGGSQRPDAKEFYPGDVAVRVHQEISEGGLALSKVETKIPMTSMDPVPGEGSGVRWLDRTTGTSDSTGGTDGYLLNGNFGKSGGMGDLEVLCDQAPLQLGNRVWLDTDGDGIQDPGEQPVAGATVNLYDEDDNKIGIAVTNSRGEYYFDSTVVKNVRPEELQYGQTYTITMDNPDDYASGGVLDGWMPTTSNAGDNDEIDSSGVPEDGSFPAIKVTPGEAGANDHSTDFGFMKPKPSVDLSVIKTGPAFVGPGGEIKYNVTVTNNGPGDASGWTVTDPLPDGITSARTSNAGCNLTAQTLTCTGSALRVGESRTITVTGDAPMPPSQAVMLNNCVKVMGNEPDPNLDNNEDCVPTNVSPIPMIDPAVASAAAGLLSIGGVFYLRRRNTLGAGL
jgi:uncharacterized repeat protein (TIGR01451 family)